MSESKKMLTITLVVVFLVLPPAVMANDSDRAAKQAELDAACEAAREEQLVPMRQALVEDCVANGEFDSREECEAFYADYGSRTGGRRGGRAALFYDLPPCVEAFEFQNSERSGG